MELDLFPELRDLVIDTPGASGALRSECGCGFAAGDRVSSFDRDQLISQGTSSNLAPCAKVILDDGGYISVDPLGNSCTDDARDLCDANLENPIDLEKLVDVNLFDANVENSIDLGKLVDVELRQSIAVNLTKSHAAELRNSIGADLVNDELRKSTAAGLGNPIAPVEANSPRLGANLLDRDEEVPRRFPKSFAEAVRGADPPAPKPSDAAARSARAPVADNAAPSTRLGRKIQIGDEAVAVFTSEELDELEKPLRFSLVGKFSYGRPPIDSIRAFLNTQSIGRFRVQLINPKHVLIELVNSDDHTKIWLRREVFIDGYPMRVFKWTRSFNFQHEPAFAPVWVRFEQLPLHFYNEAALHTIGELVGLPLRIDEPTRTRSRTNYARMCIEIDLQKPPLESVKIQQDDEFVVVPLIFEKLPKYCGYCKHVGHAEADCYIKGPKPRPRRRVLRKPVEKGKNHVVDEATAETYEEPKAPEACAGAGPSGTKFSDVPTTSNVFEVLGDMDQEDLEFDMAGIQKLELLPYCERGQPAEDISPMGLDCSLAVVPFHTVSPVPLDPVGTLDTEVHEGYHSSPEPNQNVPENTSPQRPASSSPVISQPATALRVTRGQLKKQGGECSPTQQSKRKAPSKKSVKPPRHK